LYQKHSAQVGIFLNAAQKPNQCQSKVSVNTDCQYFGLFLPLFFSLTSDISKVSSSLDGYFVSYTVVSNEPVVDVEDDEEGGEAGEGDDVEDARVVDQEHEPILHIRGIAVSCGQTIMALRTLFWP